MAATYPVIVSVCRPQPSTAWHRWTVQAINSLHRWHTIVIISVITAASKPPAPPPPVCYEAGHSWGCHRLQMCSARSLWGVAATHRTPQRSTDLSYHPLPL